MDALWFVAGFVSCLMMLVAFHDGGDPPAAA